LQASATRSIFEATLTGWAIIFGCALRSSALAIGWRVTHLRSLWSTTTNPMQAARSVTAPPHLPAIGYPTHTHCLGCTLV
jgi:hypothetical protein